MLAPALAQEIASDTTAVIGFNVLITDASGTVIGSGDPARVGTFHEASVEVVESHEPVAHTGAQAHELRGVRPGVTLPLVVDGRVVGTVGITGAPAQVRRFGLVVRRQTEILLQESASLRSRLLRERALEDLLTDIASYDAEVVEADAVEYRAAELGFDLRLPRVAIAIDASVVADGGRRTRTETTSVLRTELLRELREVFPAQQDVVASLRSGQFGVLHRVSRGESRDDIAVSLAAECRRVVDSVQVRHGLAARTAIGPVASSVAGLHDSYRDALDALRLGARTAKGDSVHAIDDFRIQQVLAGVGHGTRTRLVDRVARPLADLPDWAMLRGTVIAWCESGFSLVRASTALHIHRNTLVYRLAKIEQVSGRSPQDHRGYLALYLACLADQLDEGDQPVAIAAHRKSR